MLALYRSKERKDEVDNDDSMVARFFASDEDKASGSPEGLTKSVEDLFASGDVDADNGTTVATSLEYNLTKSVEDFFGLGEGERSATELPADIDFKSEDSEEVLTASVEDFFADDNQTDVNPTSGEALLTKTVDDFFASSSASAENLTKSVENFFSSSSVSRGNLTRSVEEFFASSSASRENLTKSVEDFFASTSSENLTKSVEDFFASASRENLTKSVEDFFESSSTENITKSFEDFFVGNGTDRIEPRNSTSDEVTLTQSVEDFFSSASRENLTQSVEDFFNTSGETTTKVPSESAKLNETLDESRGENSANETLIVSTPWASAPGTDDPLETTSPGTLDSGELIPSEELVEALLGSDSTKNDNPTAYSNEITPANGTEDGARVYLEIPLSLAGNTTDDKASSPGLDEGRENRTTTTTTTTDRPDDLFRETTERLPGDDWSSTTTALAAASIVRESSEGKYWRKERGTIFGRAARAGDIIGEI